MKGRIKHYRPSRYRPHRRRLDKRVLVLLVAAGVILLASILLGAYLNSRVDEYEQNETEEDERESPSAPVYDAYRKIEVPAVELRPTPTGAYTSDNKLDSALADAVEAERGGICFELADANGRPTYMSALYRDTFGAQAGGVDLGRFITKAEGESIRVSAVMELYSMSVEENSERTLRYSLELALIAEAYRLGVRELLICGAESMSTEQMYAMMRTIRAESPELAVGILIPLTAEQSQDIAYMSALDGIFDFIAVDMSSALAQDCGNEETPPAEGEGALERALASIKYPLERYSCRVFARSGDGCEHCIGYAADTIAKYSVGGYVLIPSDTLHK